MVVDTHTHTHTSNTKLKNEQSKDESWRDETRQGKVNSMHTKWSKLLNLLSLLSVYCVYIRILSFILHCNGMNLFCEWKIGPAGIICIVRTYKHAHAFPHKLIVIDVCAANTQCIRKSLYYLDFYLNMRCMGHTKRPCQSKYIPQWAIWIMLFSFAVHPSKIGLHINLCLCIDWNPKTEKEGRAHTHYMWYYINWRN